MPKTRFPVRGMKGLSPAVDARAENETFMLSAKNVLWDSKGLKSGFGTRLIDGNTVLDRPDGIVQTLRGGREQYLFSSNALRYFDQDTNTWALSKQFVEDDDQPRVDPWRRKWSVAYLSGQTYFAHYHYGLFKLVGKTIVELTQTTTPGIPNKPQAVAETNGRLVILGREYVSWSKAGEPENFLPELGGAGQQLLRDRIPGTPIALSVFQNGFTVWTDRAGLTSEFIGGDLVFRYDTIKTEFIPLNAWAVADMPDSTTLIVSTQGLMQTSNGSVPQSITPIFNEFLREALKAEDFQQVRIDYMKEWDILFLQIRDWTNHYVRTYALSLALDRWGVFSERHLGMIRWKLSRGFFGYVDKEGVGHRFVNHSMVREKTPGVFLPLESEVEIGYIRPEEMLPSVDSLLEMQEILVGGRPHLPSWAEYTTIDMGTLSGSIPVCAPIDILASFLFDAYYLNSSPIYSTDMFSGFVTGDLDARGLKVWPATTSRPILVTSGFAFDFSDWNLEGICYALVPDMDIDPFFYHLGSELNDTCVSFSPIDTTNIVECVTDMHLFGRYYELGNYRSQTIARYSSKDNVCRIPPSVQVAIGGELEDAMVCGVTFVFDMDINNGVYGPILHITDDLDNWILLESVGGDTRTLKATSSFGLDLETSIAAGGTLHKMGFTVNRVTDSNSAQYAISQDGGIAVSSEHLPSAMNEILTNNPVVRVGWKEDDVDSFFGPNAYFRRLYVKNPVLEANLNALTLL